MTINHNCLDNGCSLKWNDEKCQVENKQQKVEETLRNYLIESKIENRVRKCYLVKPRNIRDYRIT